MRAFETRRWYTKSTRSSAAQLLYTVLLFFFLFYSSRFVSLNIVLYWLKNGACAICTLIDANHRFLYAYVVNAQARIVFLLHCKFNQQQHHHHDIYLYATDNYQNVPFTICIHYLYSVSFGAFRLFVSSCFFPPNSQEICLSFYTHTGTKFTI